MGKKVCYTLFLTICLLLAVSVSAFAAEVPALTVVANFPLIPRIENTGEIHLLGEAEPLKWQDDSTTYLHQLEYYCEKLQEDEQKAENELAVSEDREPIDIPLDKNPVYIYNDLKTCFAEDNLELYVGEDDPNTLYDPNYWFTPALGDPLVWDLMEYYFKYGEELVPYKENEDDEEEEIQYLPKWNVVILEEAKVQQKLYADQLWLAVDAFVMDHPEYFWVRSYGSYTCEGSSEETMDGLKFILRFRFGFASLPGCDNRESRDALQEQIDAVVADLMKQTEGMSASQRIAYWDNWLAKNNTYNTAAAALSRENPSYPLQENSFPWSIVGALLPNQQPVCEGYAKTLQLLCKWSYEEVAGIKTDTSIPCVQLSGLACNNLGAAEEKWEPHMWVAIKMEDGEWYLCDSTWNDPLYGYGDPDRMYSVRNYLLTAEQKSHWIPPNEAELGSPELSDQSYFAANETTVEKTMTTWTATNESFTGFEAGSGAMMIVLYDENGKMLDLGFCEKSTQWGEDEWLYLAPTFDADVLEEAARIVRINVNGGAVDTFNWAPLTALKPILEPAAE